MASLEQIEILPVEDSAEDAEMTLRALQKHHLANKVHWVKDGAEALDYLFATGAYAQRAGLPNLILLDIKMPKVDGIEVLRRLKADPTTRAIPVVVMTSSQEERDVAQSYDLGVNSYVVKPVDFAALTELARQAGYYWLAINRTPSP